jgi:F1F0 ATPase subunit 2
MTAAEGLAWLGVFAAGLGVGAFFYGGLWWTVRRLPTMRHPAGWLLTSFVLRAGVSLVGLYLIMAGDFRRLGVAMVGMLLARMFLINRLGGRRAVQS